MLLRQSTRQMLYNNTEYSTPLESRNQKPITYSHPALSTSAYTFVLTSLQITNRG